MTYTTNLLKDGAVVASSTSDVVWCNPGTEPDMENKLDQATALACEHAGCEVVEISEDGTISAEGNDYTWTSERADA